MPPPPLHDRALNHSRFQLEHQLEIAAGKEQRSPGSNGPDQRRAPQAQRAGGRVPHGQAKDNRSCADARIPRYVLPVRLQYRHAFVQVNIRVSCISVTIPWRPRLRGPFKAKVLFVWL